MDTRPPAGDQPGTRARRMCRFVPPIMTVRYPRDRQQQLRVLAAQRGLSREEFVRQLCDEQLEAAAELAALPPSVALLGTPSSDSAPDSGHCLEYQAVPHSAPEEPPPPLDQP